MSELETFTKELYKKEQNVVNYKRKLPDGSIEKRKISYIEVTEGIWQNILMRIKEFREVVKSGDPNIGGIRVKMGSVFKVHYKTDIENPRRSHHYKPFY